ncbi:rRNA-binding ribosome biosynthesis protein rpf2 [Xanthoria parietina]
MLRQIKPKTARSKRALAKREPLAHENTKVVLLLQGQTCSSFVKDLLSDINALKRPFTVRFTKKNDIRPFEDASSLEFFSQKNDASLLLFGSHSKKRPHCMTWIRCFGGQVLDMLELYVIKDTARTLAQFKGDKCKVGLKPLLSFSGTQFESPVSNPYTLAKSIFTDFFRGGESATVDVEGLQYMISFAAGEEAQDGSAAKIHMRCWRIITKRSGQKVPRVEVEEMGPRIDFSIGRTKEAEASVWKEAMKKAKGVEPKSRKNIETDIVGDKIGRIHLGKQDLSELQTRKMKGLKREREREIEEGAEEISTCERGRGRCYGRGRAEETADRLTAHEHVDTLNGSTASGSQDGWQHGLWALRPQATAGMYLGA